jgi:hypothetical protein
MIMDVSHFHLHPPVFLSLTSFRKRRAYTQTPQRTCIVFVENPFSSSFQLFEIDGSGPGTRGRVVPRTKLVEQER